MSNEYSLITFSTANYFSVLLNSRPFYPITTILVKIVLSLLDCEPVPNQKDKDRVKWLINNTHENLKVHLAIIELATYKNLDRGLNRTIEIHNVEHSLIDLYKYLDNVTTELTEIVIRTGKKYNLDIPLNMVRGNQNVSLI